MNSWAKQSLFWMIKRVFICFVSSWSWKNKLLIIKNGYMPKYKIITWLEVSTNHSPRTQNAWHWWAFIISKINGHVYIFLHLLNYQCSAAVEYFMIEKNFTKHILVCRSYCESLFFAAFIYHPCHKSQRLIKMLANINRFTIFIWIHCSKRKKKKRG